MLHLTALSTILIALTFGACDHTPANHSQQPTPSTADPQPQPVAAPPPATPPLVPSGGSIPAVTTSIQPGAHGELVIEEIGYDPGPMSTLASAIGASPDSMVFATSSGRGPQLLRQGASGFSRTAISLPPEAGVNQNLAFIGIATVVDSTGKPHLVYYDLEHHGIKHAVLTDAWNVETIVAPAADSRYRSAVSLDFARDGTAHVAYFDADQNKLMHAWQANGTWQTQPIETLRNATGVSPLVVDAAGHPHIAYCTRSPGGTGLTATELRHATFTDAWHAEVVYVPAGSDRCGGYETSGGLNANMGLDIDSHARAHIVAYVDGAGSASDKLVYFHQSGTAWEHEELTDVRLNLGSPSIALGTRDSVHIVFSTATSTNTSSATEIRYATRTRSWNISSVLALGEQDSVSEHPSINIDSHGRPHLSYIACESSHFGSTCSIRQTVR